jgi:hypothetical protein
MTDLVPMVRDSYTSSICTELLRPWRTPVLRDIKTLNRFQCSWGTLPLEIVVIFDAVLVDSAWQRHDEIAYHLRKMAAIFDRLAQVLSVRAVRAALQMFGSARLRWVLHRMFSNSYLKVRTQPSESLRSELCVASSQRSTFQAIHCAGTWYRQVHSRP